ncbi:4-hydroxy-3-methylbut-2-enyl diphosphate reductase [Sporanaerobium hydrogeniformans]|uniref:4-hydroxy-3-methylbut-2-enyl diphosphate reductase n=1 Tax=Sporanaerobium hydrogeniformans TaxID=3072179 RepID=A0AC61DEN0_9FIRM|nr:4-hydroxy-3-methylbut-2-enyl diphosphate reductase [Sporanaerobium hydrogeniformans]PHV71166.1 4-hydroxy-3-methylbut-2-enyl diphosphate reductase [Sporanaerobium hydrogeniformans]
MEIRLAKKAGFCFGVKRAVDLAFESKQIEGTYTFGPIIHNDRVIAELKEQGVNPIDTLEGQDLKRLIIRSHGVAPTVYELAKKQDIDIVDATCPYVKKIHKLVQEHSQKGYAILIIGDCDHPEIQGISGWATAGCFIVKDKMACEMQNLPKKERTYLVVAQTTYKKEVVQEVVDYLKEQGYHFKFINTICNATKERQDEAAQMAQEVDAMLIIGSNFSSNTHKLYEVCQIYCKKSYCIAEASELDKSLLEGCERIGITAGASTPHSVIEEVIAKLKQLND